MMKKTFYSAYTCKGNLGDLLITKMQIEEYAKYSEVYVDFGTMPQNFRQIILSSQHPNIRNFTDVSKSSYHGWRFLGVIDSLKKKGFTHFTKSPGPYAVLSFPLRLFLKRMLGAVGYIYAKRKGMNIFALGIDLNYKIDKPKWLIVLNRWYFSKYNLLGLRSIPNWEDYRTDLGNSIYTPDMAFLYHEEESRWMKREKRIALSFRAVSVKSELMNHLREICSLFVKNGYQIDIVYQVEEDGKFAHTLKEELVEYAPTFLEKCIWYEDLYVYSRYEYVFSNRLHVLLLAAQYGVLPCAIISQNQKEQKIAHIYASIGMGELLSYIDSIPAGRYNSLLPEKEELKGKLIKELSAQRNLCQDIIKKMFC